MTARFLLDADFLIYALAGDADAMRWLLLEKGEVNISALAYAQVEAGLGDASGDDRERRLSLDRLLLRIAVTPFDADAARVFAKIVRAREKPVRKHAIDYMIAAQAIVISASLVTNNVRDFKGIDGLTIERWR